MLGNLSLLRSRKTVSYEEQIKSKDKYFSIFSPKLEAIVKIFIDKKHSSKHRLELTTKKQRNNETEVRTKKWLKTNRIIKLSSYFSFLKVHERNSNAASLSTMTAIAKKSRKNHECVAMLLEHV